MYLMEGVMRKQTCSVANTNASALGVHKDSQTISKVKPQIRIIHIFAPEIIKTDVANFRELVQRLTGKPTENSCTKKKPRAQSRKKESTTSTFHLRPMANKMELKSGFHPSEFMTERIKGEEEIWRGANSGGGFLGGFAELEGFMEQLNEFPVLPMDTAHMDGYGQSQQLLS